MSQHSHPIINLASGKPHRVPTKRVPRRDRKRAKALAKAVRQARATNLSAGEWFAAFMKAHEHLED